MRYSLIMAFITEELHRYCFKHVYICNEAWKHMYKTHKKPRWKRMLALWWYKQFASICPNFRTILKDHYEHSGLLKSYADPRVIKLKEI